MRLIDIAKTFIIMLFLAGFFIQALKGGDRPMMVLTSVALMTCVINLIVEIFDKLR